MKKQIAATKEFVKRNQTKILVTALTVVTVGAMIQRQELNAHNDFLREHGLYEEFTADEE